MSGSRMDDGMTSAFKMGDLKIMMMVTKLVRCKWEKWRMRISQLEDVNNAVGSVQCSRGRVNAGSALE